MAIINNQLKKCFVYNKSIEGKFHYTLRIECSIKSAIQ